jgi:hypothetical protein
MKQSNLIRTSSRVHIETETENLIETKIIHPEEEIRVTRWKKIEQAEIFITEMGKQRRKITSIVLVGDEIKSLEKALEGTK